MIGHIVSKSNLCIPNSYKVRKCNMKKELLEIKKEAEEKNIDTDVFKRSMFSMKMEWICHNFLYNIGYQRGRTGDVDIDYPCDYYEWLYELCGLLVWIFVW